MLRIAVEELQNNLYTRKTQLCLVIIVRLMELFVIVHFLVLTNDLDKSRLSEYPFRAN